ncbi:Ankyrin repeat-containing protein ITN1, partial [Cucurbita argyrosperma subsp. sororia]
MDSNLYDCVTSGDYTEFVSLIDVVPSFLHQTTVHNNTVLHLAAAFNHKNIAKEITRRQPSMLYATNSKDDTALHLAARLGSLQVAEHLIECVMKERSGGGGGGGGGGDLEADDRNMKLVTKVNLEKDTVLHDAVRNGHRGVAMLLVKNCPELAAYANKAGDSPLFLAAEKDDLEIVSEILNVNSNCLCGGRDGANVLHAIIIRTLKQPDSHGWLPLHYAANLGSEEVVELILKHEPSLAYTKDNNGVSALHLAGKEGRVAVLKTFAKLCPDSCELSDSRDRTALHFAVANRQAYAVRKMLDLASFRNLVNQQDIDGNTPLHVAAISGDFVTLMMLASHPRVHKKIMNKAGFTTNDIVRSSLNFSWYQKSFSVARLEFNGAVRGMQQVLARKPRANLLLEAGEPKPNVTEQETSGANIDKPSTQQKKSHIWSQVSDANLVVATIIATVTFSAAFQVPGGYNNNGIATLRRAKQFRLYMTFDALSFGFAAASMFVTFFTGLFGVDAGFTYPRKWVTFLTGLSLWFMVFAFMMGTSVAMDEHSKLGDYTNKLFLGFVLYFLLSIGIPIIFASLNFLKFLSLMLD